MALAIQLERLLCEGMLRNTTELARLMHVTRPRITQVMQLLHLASDIQEELLSLPPIERGRDGVAERHVRTIAAEPHWRKERRMWRALRQKSRLPHLLLRWQHPRHSDRALLAAAAAARCSLAGRSAAVSACGRPSLAARGLRRRITCSGSQTCHKRRHSNNLTIADPRRER